MAKRIMYSGVAWHVEPIPAQGERPAAKLITFKDPDSNDQTEFLLSDEVAIELGERLVPPVPKPEPAEPTPLHSA